MKNILKSWKTTLVGLIIIGGLAINVYQNGLSVQDAIWGLLAIGFFLTKDADKSHSLNLGIGGDLPPEDEEEEPVG